MWPHHDAAFQFTTEFDRKGVLKEMPSQVRERILGDLRGL